MQSFEFSFFNRSFICDFINCSFYVVGYIECAIGSLRESTGSVFSLSRRLDVLSACEIVGEYFPCTGGLAILEGHEGNKVSFLRLGCPVPGAVKSNKGTVAILRR